MSQAAIAVLVYGECNENGLDKIHKEVYDRIVAVLCLVEKTTAFCGVGFKQFHFGIVLQ